MSLTSRRLFDFQCTDGCNILFEEFVYEFEKTHKCPNCGKDAHRQISAPHIGWRIMGVDTDFPTAAGKWTKMQWQKSKKDKGGRFYDGAPNLKEY
jgi:hypothetical protein